MRAKSLCSSDDDLQLFPPHNLKTSSSSSQAESLKPPELNRSLRVFAFQKKPLVMSCRALRQPLNQLMRSSTFWIDESIGSVPALKAVSVGNIDPGSERKDGWKGKW